MVARRRDLEVMVARWRAVTVVARWDPAVAAAPWEVAVPVAPRDVAARWMLAVAALHCGVPTNHELADCDTTSQVSTSVRHLGDYGSTK
jgi:hypothetical protein